MTRSRCAEGGAAGRHPLPPISVHRVDLEGRSSFCHAIFACRPVRAASGRGCGSLYSSAAGKSQSKIGSGALAAVHKLQCEFMWVVTGREDVRPHQQQFFRHHTQTQRVFVGCILAAEWKKVADSIFTSVDGRLWLTNYKFN